MTIRKLVLLLVLLAPVARTLADPPVTGTATPVASPTVAPIVETTPIPSPADAAAATPAPSPETTVTATPVPTATESQVEIQATPEPAERTEHASQETGHVVTPADFREISLSLRPGYVRVQTGPAGWSDQSLGLTTEISMFLLPRFGLNATYTYVRYEAPTAAHELGGGPVFRYLETAHVRGSIGVNALWVNVRNGNHLGWNALVDLMVGSRRATYRPFFGPFFRYDDTLLPGKDVRGYTIGAGFTLTGLADWE
ncbi:MAG: hypothetical protein V1495_02145 [Pseudomonadota bacterium]